MRHLFIFLFGFAVVMSTAHAGLFDRWSLVNAEGLSVPIYDQEAGRNWAKLSIESFGEETHRFGHFRFRISPRLVVRNLHVEVDLDKMGDNSLSSITQKLNKLIGEVKMRYRGVSFAFKSEGSTVLLKSTTLDDMTDDGIYKIVLKGDVVIEEGEKITKSNQELLIYRDHETDELVIEYV